MVSPVSPGADRSELQRLLNPRGSLDPRMADGSSSIADSLTRAYRWVLVGIAVIAVILGLLNVYLLLVLRPPSLRYAAGEQAVTFADAAMTQRQSALRGYLLTRDAGFLAAERQAGDSLARRNDVASHDPGADPKVARLLQAMRRAQDAWTTQWAVPTIDSPPAGPAALAASLDRDRVLFDAYRAS